MGLVDTWVSMCTVWPLHSKWLISRANFVLNSSMETIWMIQKATATGNWWLAASSDNVPAYASCLMQKFLAKHQITQVTQLCYSLDLVPWDFWLFPKLESPLKGKRFQTLMRFRKIQRGSWGWLGELCEVPRGLLWRRLKGHCPMYNDSCILYLLQ